MDIQHICESRKIVDARIHSNLSINLHYLNRFSYLFDSFSELLNFEILSQIKFNFCVSSVKKMFKLSNFDHHHRQQIFSLKKISIFSVWKIDFNWWWIRSFILKWHMKPQNKDKKFCCTFQRVSNEIANVQLSLKFWGDKKNPLATLNLLNAGLLTHRK